jgi:hypothetical protein
MADAAVPGTVTVSPGGTDAGLVVITDMPAGPADPPGATMLPLMVTIELPDGSVGLLLQAAARTRRTSEMERWRLTGKPPWTE